MHQLASRHLVGRTAHACCRSRKRRRGGAAHTIVRDSPSRRAPARLWTLDGLNRLETHHIERALGDAEAGVRENAILLAERRLRDQRGIVDKLLKMETDPDGRVQFQLLLTLGGIDSPDSRAVQHRLLATNIDDPWMQIAALSASSDRAPQLFRSAAAFTDKQTSARARCLQIGVWIGADENRRGTGGATHGPAQRE